MKIITIHPANTSTGEYDVNRPLPYPYHIDAETGEVGRQEFWRGDPKSIIGFQEDPDVQFVDKMWSEVAADPETAVGMYPVFVDWKGQMFSLTTAIRKVAVTDAEEATA